LLLELAGSSAVGASEQSRTGPPGKMWLNRRVVFGCAVTRTRGRRTKQARPGA
jgi:hypothetical protein